MLVNGTPVKGSCRVKCDDEVVFSVPESVEPDIEPENIPLDILYEDADLIVVLDDGKISGAGTHDRLMATNRIYQEVYKSQQEGATIDG